jgi:prepilin-type N-terminal cleavage/methylation domain-containing protein
MNIRATSTRAFTLAELLVVIAIIAVVAGLVVGLAGVASEKRDMSRAEVELQQLVTLIEAYRAKVGVYPPDNTNDFSRSTLFYELAGAVRANSEFRTPFITNTASELNTSFGIDGVINASDDPTEVKRVLRSVRPRQLATNANGTVSLVLDVNGPEGKPNRWNYVVGDRGAGIRFERVGSHAVRNPDGFDLWAEVVVRGKTNVIGNWKD